MTSSSDGGKEYKLETDAATDNMNALINDVSYCEPRMSSSSSSSSSPAAAAAAVITSTSPADDSGSVEHLLRSIHDLLDSKLRSDATLRRQTDSHHELMKQWMIAAAELDHICFITLLFLLVAGTVAFLILLVVHP